MNIGIYGPSIAKYLDTHPWHFINLLKSHFNANIVHAGIAQCSEERILFNLKKTKKLDLAIIFHAPPYNIFIPSWHRDITNVDKTTFNKKITIREWAHSMDWGASNDEIDQFVEAMDKIPNGACFQLLEDYQIHFDNYSDAFEKWSMGDNKDIIDLLKDKVRQQNDDENFYKELWNAFELYKKYLHHPDLQMNRYYGALIQIDQYLKYKNIRCVHVLDKEKWYPNWVQFSSGPTEKSLQKIHTENSPYFVGYQESDNALNEQGNKIIFDKILELLAVSSIEVDAPSFQLGDGGSSPPAAPNKDTQW